MPGRISLRNSQDTTPKLIAYKEKLASLRVFLLELLSYTLVGVIAWLVYQEIQHPRIIIEPIEVPEELSKLGYTSSVVAEKLQDEVKNIKVKIEALALQSGSISPSDKLDSNLFTIQIPNTAITINSIITSLQVFFGYNPTHIRGDIVKTEQGYVLTLRDVNINTGTPIATTKATFKLEQLLLEGGEALLKLSDPITLVKQSHALLIDTENKEQKQLIARQLEQRIHDCLMNALATDDDEAHYYLGLKSLYFEDYKNAEEVFEAILNANRDKNKKYLGDLGLGKVYLLQNKFADADRYFKEADKLAPHNVSILLNWAAALGSTDSKLALEKVKAAEELVPTPPKDFIYNMWSVLFLKLNQPQEAIKKIKIAIELKPTNPSYHSTLATALSLAGFKQAAITESQKATEIKQKAKTLEGKTH